MERLQVQQGASHSIVMDRLLDAFDKAAGPQGCMDEAAFTGFVDAFLRCNLRAGREIARELINDCAFATPVEVMFQIDLNIRGIYALDHIKLRGSGMDHLIKGLFVHLDSTKSGAIKREDLLALCEACLEAAEDEEKMRKLLFTLVDQDKDGKVSLDDVHSIAKAWVNIFGVIAAEACNVVLALIHSIEEICRELFENHPEYFNGKHQDCLEQRGSITLDMCLEKVKNKPPLPAVPGFIPLVLMAFEDFFAKNFGLTEGNVDGQEVDEETFVALATPLLKAVVPKLGDIVQNMFPGWEDAISKVHEKVDEITPRFARLCFKVLDIDDSGKISHREVGQSKALYNALFRFVNCQSLRPDVLVPQYVDPFLVPSATLQQPLEKEEATYDQESPGSKELSSLGEQPNPGPDHEVSASSLEVEEEQSGPQTVGDFGLENLVKAAFVIADRDGDGTIEPMEAVVFMTKLVTVLVNFAEGIVLFTEESVISYIHDAIQKMWEECGFSELTLKELTEMWGALRSLAELLPFVGDANALSETAIAFLPMYFELIPTNFEEPPPPSSKEDWIQALSKNSYLLQQVPDNLKGDKEIVLAALKNQGSVIKFAAPSLKSDREVGTAAVSCSVYACLCVADELWADTEFVLNVLPVVLAHTTEYRAALEFMTHSHGKDVLQVAVGVDWASSEQRWAALNDHLPPGVGDNVEAMLKLVDVTVDALHLASPRILSNKELAMRALDHDGNALKFFALELFKDEEIVGKAFDKGFDLAEAPHEVWADKEFVLNILDHDGNALKFCAPEFVKDEEIVGKAFDNGFDLAEAPECLQSNKDLVIFIVKRKGIVVAHASEQLRADREVLGAAVESDYSALTFATADPGLHLKWRQQVCKNRLVVKTLKRFIVVSCIVLFLPEVYLHYITAGTSMGPHYSTTGGKLIYNPVSNCELPPYQPFLMQVLLNVGKAFVVTVALGGMPTSIAITKAHPSSFADRLVYVAMTFYQWVCIPMTMCSTAWHWHYMGPFASSWQAYECFYVLWTLGPWWFNLQLFFLKWCMMNAAQGAAGIGGSGSTEFCSNSLRRELLEETTEEQLQGDKKHALFKSGLATTVPFLLVWIPFVFTHLIPGAVIFAPVLVCLIGLFACIQYFTVERGTNFKLWQALQSDTDFVLAERTGGLMYLTTPIGVNICAEVLCIVTIYFYSGDGYFQSIHEAFTERRLDAYIRNFDQVLKYSYSILDLVNEMT